MLWLTLSHETAVRVSAEAAVGISRLEGEDPSPLLWLVADTRFLLTVGWVHYFPATWASPPAFLRVSE